MTGASYRDEHVETWVNSALDDRVYHVVPTAAQAAPAPDAAADPADQDDLESRQANSPAGA
jgi:hypothetical protein